MQWSREPHAGFSTADEPCRPLVEDGPFAPDEVNVADQRRDPRLAAELDGAADPPPARSARSSAGARARCSTPATPPSSPTAATGRTRPSSRCTTSPIARPSAHLVLGCEGELVDLLEDEDHALEAGELTLQLDPYGYRWFRVRRPGALLPP